MKNNLFKLYTVQYNFQNNMDENAEGLIKNDTAGKLNDFLLSASQFLKSRYFQTHETNY